MSFYYLATPYSRYERGIEQAFQDACREAALLVRCGIPIYSPIAHTHPIAIHGDMDPFDHSIWLEADKAFMHAAIGLIICELPGWDTSYGVKVEREFFERHGKPIIHMTPGLLPQELSSG